MKILWKCGLLRKCIIAFLMIFTMILVLCSNLISYLETETCSEQRESQNGLNQQNRKLVKCAIVKYPIFRNSRTTSVDKNIEPLSTHNLTEQRKHRVDISDFNSVDSDNKHFSTNIQTAQPKHRDDITGFISVDPDKKLFVYSAFLVQDLRWKLNSIRIIGVTSITSNKFPVSCLVKYKTGDEIVNGVGELVPEPRYGFKYRTALINCSPKNQNHQPVSITLSINVGHMSLPVQLTYPNNRKSAVTRCYPAIHSSMNDVNLLQQSIEMSRTFGADFFVFYNVSIGPDVSKLLEFYKTQNLVDVIPWTLPVKSNAIHYHGQFTILHDCLYRNRETSEYIFFGDLDELPVPRKHLNWVDMLKSSSNLKKNGCSAWNLRHAFFPTFRVNTLSVLSSNKVQGKELGSKALLQPFINQTDRGMTSKRNWTKLFSEPNLTFFNFTIRARAQNVFVRSKYFVSPKGVEVLSVHKVKKFSASGYCFLTLETSLLHHYRSTWADDMIPPWSRDDSLFKFKTLIMERFKTLITELDEYSWN